MAFQKPPVGNSPDFLRVRDLADRVPYPERLQERLTALLKTPEGTETLRDVQARALFDLGTYRRGFFPIRVGGGKTLISFLAPRVLGTKRPVLLLPASLIEKTKREWHHAAKNWQVSRQLRFMSYQKMGRVSGKDELGHHNPDLIIADEAHLLKNPRAAVTRRVQRFIAANPKAIFVPMSGTIMKRSIKDFAHLMYWAMGQYAPVPIRKDTLIEWSEALDENVNPLTRRSPGVLLDLYPGAYEDDGADGDDNTKRARRVFFNRTNSVSGIVSADATDAYTGSLEINALEYQPNAATGANFQKLRATMCRPDGWALSEAIQVWRVARELALGLHYAWNPAAPQEWLEKRKFWAQFVRETLADPVSSRMGLDSELQVTNAVLNGDLEDPLGLLADWRAIKPTFQVNSVPVWHDDTALKQCAYWLHQHPRGIAWVEHRFFAQALEKMSGVAYYGAKGFDHKGRFIEDAEGPIIASIAANSNGRNLQAKWSDNLITAPPCDSDRWEQLLGRTHRLGQTEDHVTADVLVGCREHLESIPRALSSADVKEDLLGFQQKLKLADITWIEGPRGGPRFE